LENEAGGMCDARLHPRAPTFVKGPRADGLRRNATAWRRRIDYVRAPPRLVMRGYSPLSFRWRSSRWMLLSRVSPQLMSKRPKTPAPKNVTIPVGWFRIQLKVCCSMIHEDDGAAIPASRNVSLSGCPRRNVAGHSPVFSHDRT